MSFKVRIEYKDGKFDESEYNMKIWKNFRSKFVIPVSSDKQVLKASLLYQHDIDVNTSNNTYLVK